MADTSLKEILSANTMAAAPALVRHESGQAVRCLACGHRCLVKVGRAGVCKVRFNRDGELRAPGHYVAGVQADPIEKKPFFHAYPGRDALSFGMLGCDLHCSYCQNWVTSQALRDDAAVAMPRFTDAAALVNLALERKTPVIVSTYNEPLITAEWAVEIFRRAKDQGLECAFVSNGNATPEVIAFLRPYVRMYKVDLKSFQDKQYRKLGCKLESVLHTIARLHEQGFWVEIVTLVVPGFNDGHAELRDMAQFIASVSKDIPWHVTAFHPDYKMTAPGRTTLNHLDTAHTAGKEAGLHFVYPGNLPGMVGDRENTFCPACGALLIERHGFRVTCNRMRGQVCPDCEAPVPGIWEKNPPRRSTGTGFPTPLSL